MSFSAAQLLAELERRLSARVTPDKILESLFPQQRAFVTDEHRKVIAVAGRRAGKSTAAAAKLLRTALLRPGTKSLYLATTRQHAKRLLWTALKTLTHKYSIPADFSETELICTLTNGSLIWLSGAKDSDSIEKFRGFAFVLVVLDESASFGKNLEELVGDVIGPGLKDNYGQLVLIGTPGDVLQGEFYEASEGRKKEQYSQHRWNTQDNEYFPRWAGKENWRALATQYLQDVRAEENLAEDDPTYIREYLGLWVRDLSNLVYAYFSERNSCLSLPTYLTEHVMALDVGYRDATAVIDISWSAREPNFYINNSFSKPGLTVQGIAEVLKDRMSKRKYRLIVADAANKTVIETLRQQYQIPIVAANKSEKKQAVLLLNSDMYSGYGKVVTGCEWISEATQVVWNEDHTREEEGQKCDLLDAALYAHRHSRHWFFRPVIQETEEQRIERFESQRAQPNKFTARIR